jgi:SAM-dependent methyltransferase
MFPVSCPFCEGVAFNTIAHSRYHKVKKDHGPFDLYKCLTCNSLVTFPLPDKKQLEELYGSFSGGINPRVRALRDDEPLTQLYEHCFKQARTRDPGIFAKKELKWLDAGAGNGELAEILSKKLPGSKGVAVDFSVPANSNSNAQVSWKKIDLNDPGWTSSLGGEKFHLIFSLAVLEHVLYPDKYLKSLADQLLPGGMLYVLSPDNNSFASKVLGKKWPFYLPGEHLNIPTMRGLSKWFQRLQQESANSYNGKVSIASIPYPWRYILGFFKLNFIAAMFRKGSIVKTRPGVLELIITKKK